MWLRQTVAAVKHGAGKQTEGGGPHRGSALVAEPPPIKLYPS
jgi:hypothetical protein